MAGRRGRGEGSVENLPSGKWRAVLPGRAKAGRSKTFATVGEARAWLRANADKPWVASGTLADWLDRWLKLQEGKVAQQSYKSDRSIARKHLAPAMGSVKLSDLTALRIEQFFAGLRTSHPSADLRHKIGKTLRTVLNAAVRPGGLLPVSPMVGVKIPPAPRPQTRALTPDELAAVLAAADRLGHGTLFAAWVELGLRPGELLGLRWEDFDPVRGTVAVVRTIDPVTREEKPPKTPREAPIPLSPACRARLDASRAGRTSGVMFGSKKGGTVWWKNNFRDFVWRPVMKAAGVKPGRQGRYIIRHTTASLLLSDGASIVAVSKRLGHSTPDFTLRKYAHLMKGDQEKATDLIGKRLSSLSPPAPTSPHAST